MAVIRVATYNIHKGVQGWWPWRRLEIHNLGHAVEQLDADIVCLQEVRKLHHKGVQHFSHWPTMPQADFLAPPGYEVVYRSNAFTRQGEHGNAMLSRWPVLSHQHHDISDHRFEQRGFLHSQVHIHGHLVHVLVVHLGLIGKSRVRQVTRLQHYMDAHIAPHSPLIVAGDFNDWGTTVHDLFSRLGFTSFEHTQVATFPARLPFAQLDRVYARGLRPLGVMVPRGPIWRRMSDHLPLIAEFDLSPEAT